MQFTKVVIKQSKKMAIAHLTTTINNILLNIEKAPKIIYSALMKKKLLKLWNIFR